MKYILTIFISLVILTLVDLKPQTTIQDYQLPPDVTSNKINTFESLMNDEQYLLNIFWRLILSFEQFVPISSWDYKQNSYGWGTTAKYKGQHISLCEANKRSLNAFKRRIDNIKNLYPHLRLYQTYLIAAFNYNVTINAWNPPLINKIKIGDSKLIITSLKYYNKAGGKRLKGLVIRRIIECNYLMAEFDHDALNKLIAETHNRLISKNGNIDINLCVNLEI